VTIIHNNLDVSLSGVGSAAADKTQTTQGATADQVQTQAQTGATTQTSEVQITSTAQMMASLEQQISSTPDVDQSRVDSIRQALSNGSYQPDAGRIADGLLAAQKFDAEASTGAGSSAQANSINAFASTAQLGSDQE